MKKEKGKPYLGSGGCIEEHYFFADGRHEKECPICGITSFSHYHAKGDGPKDYIRLYDNVMHLGKEEKYIKIPKGYFEKLSYKVEYPECTCGECLYKSVNGEITDYIPSQKEKPTDRSVFSREDSPIGKEQRLRDAMPANKPAKRGGVCCSICNAYMGKGCIGADCSCHSPQPETQDWEVELYNLLGEAYCAGYTEPIKSFIKSLLQQQKKEIIEQIEKELPKYKETQVKSEYFLGTERGFKEAIQEIEQILNQLNQ